MAMKLYKRKSGGYIALSSVLITLALVLLIGVSTSLLSINDLLSSYSSKKSSQTTDLVDACVEDVLMKLNKNNSVTQGAYTLLGGTCNVTINSQLGNDWVIAVDANKESYYKKVIVTVNRGTTVTISGWLDN